MKFGLHSGVLEIVVPFLAPAGQKALGSPACALAGHKNDHEYRGADGYKRGYCVFWVLQTTRPNGKPGCRGKEYERDGKIIKSGGPELVHELEERGYDWLTNPEAAAVKGEA